MIIRRGKQSQAGFTIIELLIAIAILSIILMSVTVVITGIGNLYFKGINQTRIQSASRTITNQLTDDIQLSSDAVTTSAATTGSGKPVVVVCVGQVRYTAVVGNKMGTNGYAHILWRDVLPTKCSPTAPAELGTSNPSSVTPGAIAGSEMVPTNSRLIDFTVTPTAYGPVKLSLGIAYGETDQLVYSSPTHANCAGGQGTQYCATAYASTIIVRRL